jgi:hypothetical protein
MPGTEGKHVYRTLMWEDAFTGDPLVVLTLAQMQGTIELGSLIPEQDVLKVVEFEVVEFERISGEELTSGGCFGSTRPSSQSPTSCVSAISRDDLPRGSQLKDGGSHEKERRQRCDATRFVQYHTTLLRSSGS